MEGKEMVNVRIQPYGDEYDLGTTNYGKPIQCPTRAIPKVGDLIETLHGDSGEIVQCIVTSIVPRFNDGTCLMIYVEYCRGQLV